MTDPVRRSRLFSLDSLRGYNESQAPRATDESLDDSSDVSFEDLTRSMSGGLRCRDIGVQVDLSLSYPYLMAQLARHLAENLPTTTASYANFEASLQQEEAKQASCLLTASASLPLMNWRDNNQEERTTTMTNRISNTTVYEDIEDVVAYFDETAEGEEEEEEGREAAVPPPLPPRQAGSAVLWRRSEFGDTTALPISATDNSTRRKNLSVHLGLEVPEGVAVVVGCGDVVDVVAAQRIAVQNLQHGESRKDLNRFLGLSESLSPSLSPSSASPSAAVVKRRRRLLGKGGAVTLSSSRNSFIESLLLGKVLGRRTTDQKKSSGSGINSSGEELRYQELVNSPGSSDISVASAQLLHGESNLNLRQRKLEHFFGSSLEPDTRLLDNSRGDEDNINKVRSASFSSTVSSSSSSSASSEPCSSSSSLSMGSSASSSVGRLFQPARFHSSLSSLRRGRHHRSDLKTTGGEGSRNGSLRCSDVGHGSSDTTNVGEDISEFIQLGMPVIPFSSTSATCPEDENRNFPAKSTHGAVAGELEDRPLDRVGHSLDALIDFARHELRRSRERPGGDRKAAAAERDEVLATESLYMEMRAQPRNNHEDHTSDQLVCKDSNQLADKLTILQEKDSQYQLAINQLTSDQLASNQQASNQLTNDQLTSDQLTSDQLIQEINQLEYMDMGLVKRVLANFHDL